MKVVQVDLTITSKNEKDDVDVGAAKPLLRQIADLVVAAGFNASIDMQAQDVSPNLPPEPGTVVDTECMHIARKSTGNVNRPNEGQCLDCGYIGEFPKTNAPESS